MLWWIVCTMNAIQWWIGCTMNAILWWIDCTMNAILWWIDCTMNAIKLTINALNAIPKAKKANTNNKKDVKYTNQL